MRIKTYEGLKMCRVSSPTLVSFPSPQWPSLVLVGLHWLLWAFFGLCWSALTSIGLCWSLLACIDGHHCTLNE
jgi:hypothetical protein